MKYFSELTHKVYETPEELEEAEKEEKKKQAIVDAEKEEKRLASKHVEELFKEANDKYKEAEEALDEFVKKYHSFHYSFTSDNSLLPTTSLFDKFFDNGLF